MDQFDDSTHVCVVIFVARETLETLHQTVTAAVRAAPVGSSIDVLINGNPILADLAFNLLKDENNNKNISIKIWKITLGDKANAWNQHIHNIWSSDSLVFYIDGYVRLHQDAIRNLINTMDAAPDSLAGTGVPSVGRSAPILRNLLLTQGGIHGNLCCIRGVTLSEFRKRQIRLPLGIYRTDSTIGAILSFGLDPLKFSWNPKKFIAIAGNATWETNTKRWWNYDDVNGAIRRVMRQFRGQIENQAIKSHLEILKLAPEKIPPNVSGLIAEWVQRFPEKSNEFVGNNPFLRRAMNELLLEKDWSDAKLPPVLL
ncbi:MAG: hypothetical protein EPN61_08475 [Burkholderiaceae bacterium]|nr:MAG: hypothetical protein EPN61_08475 [Burkholderiaceae bacterium]